MFIDKSRKASLELKCGEKLSKDVSGITKNSKNSLVNLGAFEEFLEFFKISRIFG